MVVAVLKILALQFAAQGIGQLRVIHHLVVECVKRPYKRLQLPNVLAVLLLRIIG